MNLLALPAFTDNYIWMLHNGRDAIVVDPGDSAPVRHTLSKLKLELVGILVTHHHHDHVGGIEGLHDLLQGEVHGPATERIPGPFSPVVHGQVVTIRGWQFETILIPGHTAGHVAYLHTNTDAGPLVFCGDTLFSGGCGRLFEGTPAQMLASLHCLAALPGDTQVCCTHEYTVANMKFARLVEPLNEKVLEHQRWCELRRRAGQPTLPSSIELECEINPFLRCNQPTVRQSVQDHEGLSVEIGDSGGELAVFTALRQWKNEFRA